MTIVSHRSGGAAVTDAVAGHVTLPFDEVTGGSRQLYNSGGASPKGTPRDVVGKLNAAVVAALADPDLRQQLAAQEAQLPGPDQRTPEALGAFQKAEIAKWWPIIKAANIKLE